MKTLILNHSEVEQLLPMEACISVMEEALITLARGDAHQPLRMAIKPADAAGLMGLMPAYMSGERAAYGLKAVCVFPGNSAIGKDAHQGAVVLFSAETGEILALANASAITAIRTAAVSGVATRLLAGEEAGDLAIIGSGVQARSHLEAMRCVRPIKRVRVASKRFENARKFVDEMRPLYSFPIEPLESIEAAVRGADLIVTATTAKEPIIKRAWVPSGAHLNVVGSSIPTTREVDTETMAEASLFVDRRESTLNEAGDYLFAAREGAIGPEHIRAEIGEVLIGARPGRAASEEITMFKSLGLAIEDLAALDFIYQQAKKFDTGTWVEF
ncbi:ornithine cyclodeaminase family protein [bacterium]|nr:ornithine cyclodeaminase family protein [bacterium]